MSVRAFAWLLLVGACNAESSPVLERASVEGDILYATYRGICGRAELGWAGRVERGGRPAVRLELSYTDRGESHCMREVAVDLVPIRDALSGVQNGEGLIELLVPSELDMLSFTPVTYRPEWPLECSQHSGGTFLEAAAADTFAKLSGLELASCGREWVTVGSSCCERRTEGYACLLQALETCTPTRFGEGYGTSRGAPIFTDYFVMPAQGGGCELVVMADNSQDAWEDEGAEVQTLYCASASLGIKATGECPDLVLDDCGL